MQIVDLIVPKNVQLNPLPTMGINFATIVTKIKCKLKKSTIVLKADASGLSVVRVFGSRGCVT
jgi:hypothetical protein